MADGAGAEPARLHSLQLDPGLLDWTDCLDQSQHLQHPLGWCAQIIAVHTDDAWQFKFHHQVSGGYHSSCNSQ